jgi:adenylylsulfate kinase
MENIQENIHPIFDKIIDRHTKQKHLNQNAKVLWFTGLSGSGKSTIAVEVEKKLFSKGFLTQILDGDNIRDGINNNLSFIDEDRIENIRRISEISKLFINCGIITLNSFVSPTNEIRNLAKKIIGHNDFIEIFVDTPIEICEKRDVKGLYKKARAGQIKDFTGINAPFETPENPNIIARTENKTIEETSNEVVQYILKYIKASK